MAAADESDAGAVETCADDIMSTCIATFEDIDAVQAFAGDHLEIAVVEETREGRCSAGMTTSSIAKPHACHYFECMGGLPTRVPLPRPPRHDRILPQGHASAVARRPRKISGAGRRRPRWGEAAGIEAP